MSNGVFNYDRLGFAVIFDDSYSKYYLEKHDVLLSHINSKKFLGRSVLYLPQKDDEKIIHGMNLLCLRFDSKKYNPAFFCWYTKSSLAKDFFRIHTKHAVNQASIPSSAIKEMPIPDIGLIKQKDIVLSLDRIQKCISEKQGQLKFLDCLVKSRFMEMFPDWDLSLQKANWIELKALTKIYTGTTPKTEQKDYWNGDIPWVTPAELNSDSYIVSDTERHLTEAGRASKSLSLMPVGTILLTTRAPIGKVAICGVPMACNQGFKNFECGSELNPTFLYVLLKLNVEWLQSQGTGTTFKEISKTKAEGIKISVPDIESQMAFENFYKLIDKSRFVCHSRYFL